MVAYTPQFKHKNNQKASFNCAEKVLDAVFTHVTSSAASRDSAVKLTTLGCTLKPARNFSIAYTVCKKSAEI